MAGGTGVAYATPSTEIGLAIEVTKGTAVTPSYWEKVKAPKYKPNLTMIPDDTLQGSMVSVYNLIRGLRDDQHGWDGYPRMDSFPVLIRAELGSSDTKTTAGTATTLSASALAGATSVTTTAAVTQGSYIVIGSGATQETHIASTVVTDTITLNTPLLYAQASGNAVTPLTLHTFSLLNNAGSGNQPPSLTITDYDGEEWRQLTATQLDELSIKGNATGLIEYSTTMMGNPATTPSAPTVSFSSSQATPGWTAAVLLGGTQVTTVMDWSVEWKRGTKPIPALTGNEEYYEYFAGPLMASGKLTFIEQSGSPYIAQYLSGASEVLEIFTYDLSSGSAMDIRSTNCVFKTAELDRSKEYVEVSIEYDMLPSATDATAGGVSPCQVTVANTVTTAY